MTHPMDMAVWLSLIEFAVSLFVMIGELGLGVMLFNAVQLMGERLPFRTLFLAAAVFLITLGMGRGGRIWFQMHHWPGQYTDMSAGIFILLDALSGIVVMAILFSMFWVRSIAKDIVVNAK